MFQFQGENVTHLWCIRRSRRILPSFIRSRIPGILILLCICSLLTSFVFKRNQKTLEKMNSNCNESAAENWRGIFVPGQIRTVKGESRNNSYPENEIKIILLWTTYFSEEYSNDFYFFRRGKETFQRYKCKFSNCFVTSNRSLLSTADAVLFHARDLNFSDIPKRLNDKQIWVLYSMEPPKYMVLKWNLIQSLFNWTMTYRSDSDVQVKYGQIIPHGNFCNPVLSRHKNVFERSKGAIWMVSNCRTESRREAYVRELKKLFDVDIYGKCSRKKRCEPVQSEACYKLLNDYKYYLSFENSVCKDYITEKFFNILKYDIIPVVLGGGDYSSIAPHNSFIDATSFPTPQKLAKHLTDIANNSSLYDSFFEWKKHYSVYLHPWMCDLCERLHKPRFEPKTLPKDLWSWWVPRSFCRRWTRKKGFKNIF